jgi:hypothetical protein
MAARNPSPSFRTIRTWAGTQPRAFEELCYQLLREPEDLPPRGSLPVRTGSPDGGVEWYVNLQDGTQWGWQAKYYFPENIDALLTAMTESVRTVVVERPTLRRLTFCIPFNLADSTAKGRRTPARQRYDDLVRRWRADIAGAKDIEFLLVRESDLVDRLSLSQHIGRRTFWFDQTVLTREQLQETYEQAKYRAGKRYRPELQVDLPIEADLQALGYSDKYFEELERYRAALVRALRGLRPPETGYRPELGQAFEMAFQSCQRLRAHLREFDFLASRQDPLESATELTKEAESTLIAYGDLTYNTEKELSSSAEKDHPTIEHIRSQGYYARLALGAVRDLDSFWNSPASSAVRQRAYFLAGGAGTGKTHLLLDAARKALDEERPIVVVFGSDFGEGTPWATLAEQLGLSGVGRDELLGAMSACAEASTTRGRRFVLAIDALNESVPPSYWARHLASLRAAIAQWPNIALAVSCRDTYLQVVDPEDRRSADFAVRQHPGFVGREVEATHQYFQAYGLVEPRLPLLLPEFTIPLFLWLYCESLADSQDPPPEHHEGRVEIFNRFLASKKERAAKRLRPDAGEYELSTLIADIHNMIDALLDECIRTGREDMPTERSQMIVNGLQLLTSEEPIRIVSALVDEGLLSYDQIYRGGRSRQGLRFTFQAFADYLILRRKMDQWHIEELRTSSAFRRWLNNASYGIHEAAAVVLPELAGIELPDFLPPRRLPGARSGSRTPRSYDGRYWYRDAVMRTLPYRSAGAVTNRTIQILNESLRLDRNAEQFFNTMFLIAPQAHNPLNADRLHANLLRLPMARRDAWFGRTMYHALDSDNSPVSRLARWAASGPYPTYDPEVIELAAIPLVWLFGSPNRFVRDWLTKTLVNLLRGHPDVLVKLMDRFSTVDDAYVWERLLTVAYGCVLRRMDQKPIADYRGVVEFVDSRIFSQIESAHADAFMLDAARGIVEWGASNGLTSAEAVAKARPPYGFKRPGRTWGQKYIEERYYAPYVGKPDEGYSALYWSLFGIGDFARYVVETGVGYFSSVPLNRPAPTKEWYQERPRLSRRRLAQMTRLLTTEQAEKVVAAFDGTTGAEERQDAIDAVLNDLPFEQLLSLSESLTGSRGRKRRADTRYSSERACRWIFQRVIRLGWSPQLFGSFDRLRGGGLSANRSSHKAERFGKKYQWIAYHELLARVADNYHPDPFRSDERPYVGLHQIGDRDIDPSLPPVAFTSLLGEEAGGDGATFTGSPIEVPFPQAAQPDLRAARADVDQFLSDSSALPTVDKLLRVTDSEGESWIVLNGSFHVMDQDSDDPTEYRGLEQWCSVFSCLTATGELRSAVAALRPHLDGSPMSELIGRHGHSDCCYLGELVWRQMECYHHGAEPFDLTAEVGGQQRHAWHTVEDYAWSASGVDCSINDGVSITTPSAFIAETGKLSWTRSSPTWTTSGQIVMAYVGRSGTREHEMLVAREDWLRAFLQSQRMALLVGARGERRYVTGDFGYWWPYISFDSVVALGADGRLRYPGQRVQTHPERVLPA